MNKLIVIIASICFICFSCNSSSVSEDNLDKIRMDSILRVDSIKASQSDFTDSVFVDSILK